MELNFVRREREGQSRKGVSNLESTNWQRKGKKLFAAYVLSTRCLSLPASLFEAFFIPILQRRNLSFRVVNLLAQAHKGGTMQSWSIKAAGPFAEPWSSHSHSRCLLVHRNKRKWREGERWHQSQCDFDNWGTLCFSWGLEASEEVEHNEKNVDFRIRINGAHILALHWLLCCQWFSA